MTVRRFFWFSTILLFSSSVGYWWCRVAFDPEWAAWAGAVVGLVIGIKWCEQHKDTSGKEAAVGCVGTTVALLVAQVVGGLLIMLLLYGLFWLLVQLFRP
jgi:hypothetical protein